MLAKFEKEYCRKGLQRREGIHVVLSAGEMLILKFVQKQMIIILPTFDRRHVATSLNYAVCSAQLTNEKNIFLRFFFEVSISILFEMTFWLRSPRIPELASIFKIVAIYAKK